MWASKEVLAIGLRAARVPTPLNPKGKQQNEKR
jgi:hypothetical protein